MAGTSPAMTGMSRKLTSPVVIATHNPGKLTEMRELLAPYGIATKSAAELGLREPEEAGKTFAANARIKATAAARASGGAAFADDSGLVIPALGGEPGIYSARWAGPRRDFSLAMQTVEDRLRGKPDRHAHFVAVLALAWPDGHAEVFRGEAHGVLIWPPRGDKGFGYDPMFQPHGDTRTYGEIEPAEKHRISHRADAFRKLVAACFEPHKS